MENKQTSFEAIRIEKLLFEQRDYRYFHLFLIKKAFFHAASV